MSRSHAVYSYQSRANVDKNVALVTVGVIDVEIPQHPVALHTMMTRSSRTISRQITDIQSQRSIIRFVYCTTIRKSFNLDLSVGLQRYFENEGGSYLSKEVLK